MTSKHYLLFPVKVIQLFYFASACWLKPPKSHLPPTPPPPWHCFQSICIVSQRAGQAVIVVIVMAEGFSHQLLLSSGGIKTPLCCCRWCHGPETTQSCFPGKPHIRKSRHFFPLLDCSSRAAWKRLFLIRFPYCRWMRPAQTRWTQITGLLLICPFLSLLCFRIHGWVVLGNGNEQILQWGCSYCCQYLCFTVCFAIFCIWQ